MLFFHCFIKICYFYPSESCTSFIFSLRGLGCEKSYKKSCDVYIFAMSDLTLEPFV